MNLLHNLNPPQKEAVLHGEGPLLILAGAGSGKTRVIVHRIVHLIRDLGVPPWQILAVTFTNKAAGEMRERVARLLGGGEVPLISTFHSACARILRRDIQPLGYESNFTIYDDKDAEKLLKEIVAGLNLDEKRFPAKAFAAAIDECKNSGRRPEDVADGDYFQEKLVRVYSAYQERLKKCNALDFGDLMMLTVQLLETVPEVLARYREKFRWILVDEYQDTNPIQYRLIRLLAGERKNLCVVGDDDQSIYRWRGADIRNILDFEKDFPGVRVVKLEQNYRSTQTILTAAGEVVAKNRGRKAKTLWTENPGGDKIIYRRLENEREEARFVCRETERHLRPGRSALRCCGFLPDQCPITSHRGRHGGGRHRLPHGGRDALLRAAGDQGYPCVPEGPGQSRRRSGAAQDHQHPAPRHRPCHRGQGGRAGRDGGVSR